MIVKGLKASGAVPITFKAAAGNLLSRPMGRALPALTSISIAYTETQVKPKK